MDQNINSLLTGLTTSLDKYLGMNIKNRAETQQYEQKSAIDLNAKGKITSEMAESLLPGKGKDIVDQFVAGNNRLPTLDEAKDFLNSSGLLSGSDKRKDYFTVLGYDEEKGGYVTHNAATNEFNVQPLSRMIGKTKPNMPAAEAEWFSKAENVANVMDEVNKIYKDSYVGPLAGRAGRAVDLYSPFGDADRSKFRNLIAKGFNNLVYLRSGKQINQEEANRMAEEFMSQNNTPIAFKSAWDTMAKELNTLAQERQANFDKMGYANADKLKGKGSTKAKYLSNSKEKPSLDEIFKE